MAIHGLLPREVTPHMAGFELFEFHVGCNIGDAWVGVDLGAGNTVNNVKCVRIFQAAIRSVRMLVRVNEVNEVKIAIRQSNSGILNQN